LSAHEADDLAVLEGERLVGFIGRAELTRYLELNKPGKG